MEINTTGSSDQYRYLVLHGNESVLMREALERRSWWAPAKSEKNWNLWYGANGQKFDFKGFSASAKARRVVNRLENHREVCTKSGLASNLARICTLSGGPSSVPWIPETYVLPSKGADQRLYDRFTSAYRDHAAAGRGTTWIVKPTSLNRGNGIEVFNRLDDILAHLNARSAGSSWIVQKYIDDPALVGGRKFDIRAYVLFAPDKRVYMCKEAYVRTSSTPYKLDDLSDKSSHLTNDAVQKHLDSYHTFEDHCKMSMTELQDSLGPSVDVPGSVFPQMRECARTLFGLVAPKLNPRNLQLCYELLGLDFMIDAKGQVYLIEVNTSPALFRAGKYLTDLLPRVVEEMVQKCVDPYFPPPPQLADAQLPEPLDNFELLELVDLEGQRGKQRGMVRSSSLGPATRGSGPSSSSTAASGSGQSRATAGGGGAAGRELRRFSSSGPTASGRQRVPAAAMGAGVGAAGAGGGERVSVVPAVVKLPSIFSKPS